MLIFEVSIKISQKPRYCSSTGASAVLGSLDTNPDPPYICPARDFLNMADNEKKKRRPADRAQTKATHDAFPTDDHKRAAIRGIMQRMEDHPDRSVEDISTKDFRVTNQSRQTWIRKLGMKQEWDERCTSLAVIRTSGYRFSKHQQAIIMRRLIDGWACGGAEKLTWEQAAEKYAPEITLDCFELWLAQWPTFQEQVKGAKLIRNHFGERLPVHCNFTIEFAAGYTELDFPKMLTMLGLYPEPIKAESDAPKRLGDLNKVQGMAWYTRDQCMQKVGLDPMTFFHLTKPDGGPFRDAWMACSAQRDANMRSHRTGIKDDLRVRYDEALLSAMSKGVVMRSEKTTTIHTDRYGELDGESTTTKEFVREEVDSKILPYVAKVINEAPTDKVEVDHRHIIYGEAVHADIKDMSLTANETLEVLMERRRLAKSEALGMEEVEEIGWGVQEEGDREWEPDV